LTKYCKYFINVIVKQNLSKGKNQVSPQNQDELLQIKQRVQEFSPRIALAHKIISNFDEQLWKFQNFPDTIQRYNDSRSHLLTSIKFYQQKTNLNCLNILDIQNLKTFQTSLNQFLVVCQELEQIFMNDQKVQKQ
jgi:hypothetical protein